MFEQQKENSQQLKGRQVLPTRFLDLEFFSSLGIANNLKGFMKIIGIKALYNVHVNTYKSIMFEFYSSFEVTKPRPKHISYVSYRLLN